MPISNIPWDQALLVLQILSLFRYGAGNLLQWKQSTDLRKETSVVAASTSVNTEKEMKELLQLLTDVL